MAIRDRDTEKSKQQAEQKKQASDVRAETKRKPLPQRAAPRKGTKSPNALIRYFQDTGDELRKVSWPTREQAVRLTVVVLGSTIVAAIFFGALDTFFQWLASLLV